MKKIVQHLDIILKLETSFKVQTFKHIASIPTIGVTPRLDDLDPSKRLLFFEKHLVKPRQLCLVWILVPSEITSLPLLQGSHRTRQVRKCCPPPSPLPFSHPEPHAAFNAEKLFPAAATTAKWCLVRRKHCPHCVALVKHHPQPPSDRFPAPSPS